MFCSSCGAESVAGDHYCTHCGKKLPSGPVVVVEDRVPMGCIPKNLPAVIGYYFGIFSLVIPILCLPAIGFGIAGLRRAAVCPEEKGKIHACVGIAGGVIGALECLFIASVILGVMS